MLGVNKSFVQPRPLLDALRHPLRRRRVEVLQGVELSVPTGVATGLLGANGAGKTTLLRILSAAVLPDRGEVRILGRPVGRRAGDVRRRVGVVLSEERSFFWRLTARQNLEFFAVLYEMDSRGARARIDELVQLVEMGEFIDRPFRLLSTGMRQRLLLARALLHDPQVLLVDEPTRALDPGAAERIRRLLRESLVQKLGKTLLVATHQLAEARELCDRVALLQGGRILSEGPAPEALARAGEIFASQERGGIDR